MSNPVKEPTHTSDTSPGANVAIAIGRLILGMFVGGFLYLGSWYVWEWNSFLLAFFTITGGLAGMFLGDRFFEWVKENWWWT